MTSYVLSTAGTHLFSLDTWTIFLLSLLLLAVVKRRFDRMRRTTTGLQRPPCLPSLPILGSVPLMFGIRRMRSEEFVLMRDIADLCMKKSKTMGNVIAFYSMSTYTVVLSGKTTIHEALVTKGVHFADRKQLFLEKYCTNPKLMGISFSPYGEVFIKRRNLVLSILRGLGFGKRISENLIHANLALLLDSLRKTDGQPFNPASLLQVCVSGIILAFVFGGQFEADDPLLTALSTFIEAGSQLFWQLEVTPLLRFWPSYWRKLQRLHVLTAKLADITDGEINKCLSSGNEDNLVCKYVQKRGLTAEVHEDLHYIVRDLFTAGSDTLIASLRWLLVTLANHTQLQEELHRQVDEFYGDGQRLPSFEDLPHLPLIEATILEELRLEPLKPIVGHMTFCDTELQGYFIPKGSLVYASLHSVNMDPDQWENVSEFNPKRFIGDDGKVFGKDRLIPFSLGKRACPGEPLARPQLFILLTGILQRFQICPPDGETRIDVKHLPSFLVEPSAFEVRLIARHQTEMDENL